MNFLNSHIKAHRTLAHERGSIRWNVLCKEITYHMIG